MRSLVLGLAVSALLLAHSGRPAAAQSGYDLFQQALVKERSNGEIREAIALYERIVAEHGSNRALAARALVQMGRAYETLGSPVARGVYERVVRDYADQAEQVSLARSRLGVLSPSAASSMDDGASDIVVRQIWEGAEVDPTGVLSPDENEIAFTDWNSGGNLAVKDLRSGAVRQLTHVGFRVPPYYVFVMQGQAWSPDGKRIAYALNNEDGYYDLRVIDADGRGSRVVYANPEVDAHPLDWSHDGEHILTLLQHTDRSYRLALVSVETGAQAQLLAVGPDRPSWTAKFSPDDRFIVVDLVRDDNRDVYVLSSDGSALTRITDSPGQDGNPLWSPDGARIVYVSDRSGTRDLWGQDMSDGRPSGPSHFIKSDIGRTAYLTTWTGSGKLLFGTFRRTNDIYSVPVDAQSGEATGVASRLTTTFLGRNTRPSWSPDGRRLAHVSGREGGNVLAVMSLDAAPEIVLRRDLGLIQALAWSPDGDRIAVSERSARDGWGTQLVDVETGAATSLVRAGEEGDWNASVLDWSPDGEEIIFPRRGQPKPGTVWFYAVNVATRAIREISVEAPEPADDPSVPGSPVYSPDGQHLAFVMAFMKGGEPARGLWMVPSGGGEATEVFSHVGEIGGRVHAMQFPSWSPDGDKIVVVCRGGLGSSHLEVVPLSGEPPTVIALAGLNPTYRPAWSPNGSSIAVTSGEGFGELWVLENFLPEPEGGAPGGAR